MIFFFESYLNGLGDEREGVADVVPENLGTGPVEVQPALDLIVCLLYVAAPIKKKKKV